MRLLGILPALFMLTPLSAVAAYVPGGSYNETRCPVAASGTVTLTDACDVWEVTSGNTDTTFNLPAASTMPGRPITLVDTAKIADTTWLRLHPASGETLDYSLDADQMAVLPQSGAHVTLVSNGTDWRCMDGCADLVIWPPSVSGMVFWLDPLKGMETDSGTDGRRHVAIWRDQSGRNYDFAEVSNSGPVYTVGAKGIPQAHFNSTARFYLRGASIQFGVIDGVTEQNDTMIAGVFASNANAGTLYAWDDKFTASLFASGIRLDPQICTTLRRTYSISSSNYTAARMDSDSGTMAVTAPTPAIRQIMWSGSYAGTIINGSTSYLNTSCAAYGTYSTSSNTLRYCTSDCYSYLGQRHTNNANANYFTGVVQTFMFWNKTEAHLQATKIDKFLLRRHRMR